jgi:hypothetical protein
VPSSYAALVHDENRYFIIRGRYGQDDVTVIMAGGAYPKGKRAAGRFRIGKLKQPLLWI